MSQRLVHADCVLVPTPAFDDDPRFGVQVRAFPLHCLSRSRALKGQAKR